MSKLLLTFAAITTIVLIGSYIAGQTYSSEASKIIFKSWMKLHGKNYFNEEQFNYRFNIFSKNAIYVSEHNARYAAGLESFDLEMNKFADLNSEQFKAIYLMKNVKATTNCTGKAVQVANLKDDIDWTQKGAVTPIKNQGQCGSCWSFSATGSLEGCNFLQNNNLLSFSEQVLMDCSTSYGNQGCNGGWMDSAFYFVIDQGIALQSKFPYKGVDSKCTYNSGSDSVFKISNCVDVKVNVEAALLSAINVQPVSVAIQANHLSFQLYKSGVYSGLCGTNLDHGVLAVGYGTSGSKGYYKVKNSWGTTWGQKGFILIERTGDGKGKCGIQMAASYPLA